MSFPLRISIGGVSVLLVASLAGGCEGTDELTPLPDASTTTSSSGEVSSSSGGGNVDGGGSSGSAADASTDASSVDASPDAGATSCRGDDDCNGEAAGSRPAGTCQLGICVCNPGFIVQPSGACAATRAPECAVQGGTCSQTAECAAGSFGSESQTNLSCGDKREASCCFAEGACKGPNFRCVAPNDAQRAPICVNGWRTCEPGLSAMAPRP